MSKDWGTYRKLFENPPPAFERLPFAVRALAAEVIRRCDRNGRIVPSGEAADFTEALLDDLMFHVRAHESDREFLRTGIDALLNDGYLVFETGYLTIRNFAKAQRSSTSAERMARKREKDKARDSDDVTDVTDVTELRHGDDVTDRARVRLVSSSYSGSRSDPPDRLGADSETASTPLAPPESVPREATRDRFREAMEGRLPHQRRDVARVFEAYKLAFSLPNARLLRGDVRAEQLAERIDAYGEDACTLVAQHAPQDGMVSGKADERGHKHTSVGYVFGNASAFERILHAAQAREGKSSRQKSARERVEEARRL